MSVTCAYVMMYKVWIRQGNSGHKMFRLLVREKINIKITALGVIVGSSHA